MSNFYINRVDKYLSDIKNDIPFKQYLLKPPSTHRQIEGSKRTPDVHCNSGRHRSVFNSPLPVRVRLVTFPLTHGTGTETTVGLRPVPYRTPSVLRQTLTDTLLNTCTRSCSRPRETNRTRVPTFGIDQLETLHVRSPGPPLTYRALVEKGVYRSHSPCSCGFSVRTDLFPVTTRKTSLLFVNNS